MKRKLRLATALCIASALPVTASAHGGMDHVMGTVQKIDGNVLTVESSGQRTQVWLTAATTYEIGTHAAARNDLRLGDRVVIHAVKVEGKEQAHDVRLAHPAR